MNLVKKINKQSKPEVIFWFLLFSIIFSFGFILRFQSYDIQYDVDKYNVITSDGVGYYSYLPSIFVQEKFKNRSDPNQYLLFDKDPKTHQNKYFVGTSILMSPFFCVAHAYTSIRFWIAPENNFKPNGYTFPYHIAIIFAGVFYLILGLFYIKRTALLLGIKKEITFFLIVLFALGTQLMGLSSYEASFSHTYAFFTISFLIYNWHLFTKNPNLKHYLYIGISASLLLIIRPTDILIIISFPIFFIINGHQQTVNWLKKQRNAYFYLLLIGGTFLYLQLYFWKLQSGAYFIWSYTEEGFDFFNPEIWNVLFSYKKGLFVYTPLLIAVFIYIYLSSIKLSIKVWFTLFFFINTYVISSWWCWWYGGSFGMRSWMDFLPIVILISALGLNKTNFNFRILFYALSALSIPINTIQNYQYSSGKMHWDSMTKEKYWQIFLKTDEAFNFVTFDPPETYKKHEIIDSTEVKIDNTFDSIFSVEKNNMFHTLLEKKSQDLFLDSLGTYIKVSFEGKLEFMREAAVLTANKNLIPDGVDQKSQRIISYIRKTNEWIEASIIFDLGKKIENEQDFGLFFYNNQRNFFWFKNVKVTFYNYKLKQNDL